MPLLEILIIISIISVVFVNGWTDAPNAIAGVVSTNALSYRKAVGYAAFCNLLGLLAMSIVNSSVADTITSMADFRSENRLFSLAALLSALTAIVIFAVSAWRFGIPTSESHALIAALTGAAIALGGGISVINPAAWRKILAGLAISLILGFFFGFLFSRIFGEHLKRLGGRVLDKLQIFSAGVMAFMHGAQDGQKFAAVFVIAELLAKGVYGGGSVKLREHMAVLLLSALTMALGTSAGGRRIIETIGTKMTALKKPQSVCSDMASGLCLFIASLTGIPMSTTHTKTTAIMGASVRGKKNPVDFKIVGEMLFAWILTFPVCAALGFLLTRIAVDLITRMI